MKVQVTSFLKDGVNTVYKDGKPVRTTAQLKLPLRFGYGSYNEPKKLLDQYIDVEDIISIEEVPGELDLLKNELETVKIKHDCLLNELAEYKKLRDIVVDFSNDENHRKYSWEYINSVLLPLFDHK